MQRQATDWDKILQTTNLTKDQYLENKQVSKLNNEKTMEPKFGFIAVLQEHGGGIIASRTKQEYTR